MEQGVRVNNQQDSAGGVGRLFSNLRPRSKHSVSAAIEAATHEGLTGTLIIQIHAGVDKPTEAYFTNADLKLIPAIGLK